jgi:hypothetical protein
MLVRDKHSSLSDPLISYEENKAMKMALGLYSQHYIFFVNYEIAQ